MTKQRLDQSLVERGLTPTRSQAESWIGLGKVFVNGQPAKKSGQLVRATDTLELRAAAQYVSRAALKLASVASTFGVDFKDKTVLDVGSSTGGFTDFALKNGASGVIAVELGKEQLHHSLRASPKIELHEQTDIRSLRALSAAPDIVVIDVSFVSLRDILPHVATLVTDKTDIIAMVKPQFEAQQESLKHKGIIKNDRMRRDILKGFEQWAAKRFSIVAKADSAVAGAKGNVERFYVLRRLRAV